MTTKHKKIIHLDSKDFVTGSSNNEPTLTIDHGFELKKCKNAEIRVSSYSIPNTFFQVSATLGNNTFEFEEDDGNPEYTITITSGWYTFSTLIDELETQIAASLATSASVTVTFSLINGKITFTSDGATDIKLNLAGNQAFADLIGFTAVDGTFANTQTSTYPADMLPIKYIFLECDELKSLTPLGTQVHSSTGLEKMIFKIPTVGDFGDVNVLRENTWGHYSQPLTGNIPKKLTMRCVDRDGNVIDFNNISWSVDFEISYDYY